MTPSAINSTALRSHTVLFAQSLCSTISDMAGFRYSVSSETLSRGFFEYDSGGMIVFTHFSGHVQGDYIIAMHEATAAAIAGMMVAAWTPQEMKRSRETFGGFSKELLNVSVHQIVTELEKHHGLLTILPPTAVYGEMDMPGVTSGTVEIDGDPGVIQCTVSLNMTGLKVLSRETY